MLSCDDQRIIVIWNYECKIFFLEGDFGLLVLYNSIDLEGGLNISVFDI